MLIKIIYKGKNVVKENVSNVEDRISFIVLHYKTKNLKPHYYEKEKLQYIEIVE